MTNIPVSTETPTAPVAAEALAPATASSVTPRAIAIVSGKGGSGKTMIAASIARILDESGQPTLLMDGDVGTGGLSYYMGMRYTLRRGAGVADAALRWNQTETLDLKAYLQPLTAGFDNTMFLGVGDHWRLLREMPETDFPALLGAIVAAARKLGRWLIIDCRGGIDHDSVAVCEAVDDVLLIAETDTTSFQATQHLVDVLARRDIVDKLRGFIINKAFDDPAQIARNGTAVFRSQYLGAVPFDIASTRDFLLGYVPDMRSTFVTQVWGALHQSYPEVISEPIGRVWQTEDFKHAGVTDLESWRGGLVAASLILLTTIMATWTAASDTLQFNPLLVMAAIGLLGLLGAMEDSRRALGRVITYFVNVLKSDQETRRQAGGLRTAVTAGVLTVGLGVLGFIATRSASVASNDTTQLTADTMGVMAPAPAPVQADTASATVDTAFVKGRPTPRQQAPATKY